MMVAPVLLAHGKAEPGPTAMQPVQSLWQQNFPASPSASSRSKHSHARMADLRACSGHTCHSCHTDW